MYGISHIRSVSVGLDSQILYLFIYITGYLNVRKISETMDFRTFKKFVAALRGAHVDWKGSKYVPLNNVDSTTDVVGGADSYLACVSFACQTQRSNIRYSGRICVIQRHVVQYVVDKTEINLIFWIFFHPYQPGSSKTASKGPVHIRGTWLVPWPHPS